MFENFTLNSFVLNNFFFEKNILMITEIMKILSKFELSSGFPQIKKELITIYPINKYSVSLVSIFSICK